MSKPPYPSEPEFSAAEEAAAYDRWFREQVKIALDDPRPTIPHDEVMADMRALIASKRRKNKPPDAA